MPFETKRATVMSLVAYERSFKADLLPHVVFKIILSENGDIWVERWTKTFVLGCNIKQKFGAVSWLVGLYVRWNLNSPGSCFASYLLSACLLILICTFDVINASKIMSFTRCNGFTIADAISLSMLSANTVFSPYFACLLALVLSGRLPYRR